MERAHARLLAIRFRILQVNDSDNEASAVINSAGQGFALARDAAGHEAARGMKLAGISIAGRA